MGLKYSHNIHGAKFGPKFTQEIFKQHEKNKNLQIIDNSLLCFYNNKYLEYQLNELVDCMIEWKLQILLIWYSSQCSQILKQLINVRWPQLIQLQLDCDNIINIEALAFLHAPQLKTISLRQNLISQIKSVNKLLYNNLSTFQLQNNKLSTLQSVGRILTAKRIISIYKEKKNQNVCQQDESILAKLYCIHIDQLRNQRDNQRVIAYTLTNYVIKETIKEFIAFGRIKNDKKINSLKRKFLRSKFLLKSGLSNEVQ